MSASPGSVLQRLIAAGWRRRVLLLVPVIVMLPFSIAFVTFVPGTYVTRALLQLQEENGGNPLARDASSRERIPERVAGLRTLLSSEFVLGPVVDQLDGAPGHDPTHRAAKIEELRRLISVNLLGSEFLEIRMTGSPARGLGAKLDAVITSFLNALTAQDGLTVGEVLVRKQRDEVGVLEAKRRELRNKADQLTQGGSADVFARIRTLASEAEALQKELIDAASTQARLESELGAKPLSRDAATEEVKSLQPRDATSSKETMSRVQKLKSWALLDDRRSGLESKLLQIRQEDQTLKSSLPNYEPIAAELRSVEGDLLAARRIFDAYSKRFGGGIAFRNAGLLSAPERMILVEPPKDPELRMVPRSYFVLAGLVSGTLLGLGLAVAAEALDDRVRYPEDMVAIIGVPIVGRLPRMDPSRVTEEVGNLPAIPEHGIARLRQAAE